MPAKQQTKPPNPAPKLPAATDEWSRTGDATCTNESMQWLAKAVNRETLVAGQMQGLQTITSVQSLVLAFGDWHGVVSAFPRLQTMAFIGGDSNAVCRSTALGAMPSADVGRQKMQYRQSG